MRIAVHEYRTDLVEAFKTYVERRLRFALNRFGGRVGRVTVRISADGPAENVCRISAEILHLGRIAVEENDSDLFAAIDRATGRIGWLFGRELERARDTGSGRESIRLTLAASTEERDRIALEGHETSPVRGPRGNAEAPGKQGYSTYPHSPQGCGLHRGRADSARPTGKLDRKSFELRRSNVDPGKTRTAIATRNGGATLGGSSSAIRD